MKVKILKKFRDKHTKKVYLPGEEIEFTKKRVKEILKKGKMIEEIEGYAEETEQKKATSRRTKKETQ